MQTIERTFLILRLIAQGNGEIRLSQIAKKLHLSKSTISRFLNSLEAEGIVRRLDNNRFALGQQLYHLTQPEGEYSCLVQAAKPALESLNEKTGESVTLSVLNNEKVTYLFYLESQSVVQVVDWTGKSVPLHVISSGKLFLAQLTQFDDTFLDKYLQRPLPQFTPKTITTKKALIANLSLIRSQGYALSDEEFALEVVGIAVPIVDEAGGMIAAISIYGPKYRLSHINLLYSQLNDCKGRIETQFINLCK